MHGYVYVIIKNSKYKFSDEDIEEIASDVFLTIWQAKEKLDKSKLISSYIAGVTKNLILKKIRESKIHLEDIEDYKNTLGNSVNTYSQTEENEKINIITNSLLQMKKEDRDIFIYYYYQSKSIKEISKLMNISTIKVKSRLSRIRKKFKKELEKRGYSYGK